MTDSETTWYVLRYHYNYNTDKVANTDTVMSIQYETQEEAESVASFAVVGNSVDTVDILRVEHVTTAVKAFNARIIKA